MDAFYTRFFPGESSDAEAGYHRELQSRLLDARQVLDFGCGDNCELARYRTPDRQVWGVDVLKHPYLWHPEWFRLLDSRGRAPFADSSFDVIGSCWVLEHIRHPTRFLAEVQRLLRPGGFFVSLSINSLHYVTFLSRLVGLLPHTLTQQLVHRLYGRAIHETFPTYYQLNSSGQLRRLAQKSGLELTGLNRFENPDYFSFSPRLRQAAIVLDWLLGRFNPELGRVYFVATLHKPVLQSNRSPLRFAA
jgi:SAM-dependent methyltransferase